MPLTLPKRRMRSRCDLPRPSGMRIAGFLHAHPLTCMERGTAHDEALDFDHTVQNTSARPGSRQIAIQLYTPRAHHVSLRVGDARTSIFLRVGGRMLLYQRPHQLQLQSSSRQHQQHMLCTRESDDARGACPSPSCKALVQPPARLGAHTVCSASAGLVRVRFLLRSHMVGPPCPHRELGRAGVATRARMATSRG